MQYCEIQIELNSRHIAPLHAVLYARQLSFQESDQTTLNAPPLGRTRIHVYIPADERAQIPDLLSALQKAAEVSGGGAPALAVEVRDRDEVEWRDTWKRFFATRRIGRLAIVPSWEVEAHTPAEDEVTLHMDPGRAFGTGGHESTRLCLRLLDQLAGKLPLHSAHYTTAADRLEGRSTEQIAAQVLDVGCGSGVLTIAALRLWPKANAVAIDIDGEAVEVTGENAARNGVTDRLLCETTPLEKISMRFALVLANLTGPTLIELAEPLAARVEAGGVLMLAGILENEVDTVAARFLAQGLVETVRATEDEWAALEYVRPNL